MKRFLLILAVGLSLMPLRAEDDFLDDVGDHLRFHAFNGYVSGKFSGLFDLEEYYTQPPPPGVIYSNHNFLTNPRLTLNLDVQIGPQFYLFAQARVDRGFDPADEGTQVQAEQYALRYTPWQDGRFNVQAGKFATVMGSWARRDDSWTSPFVTPPLVYSNLTGVWDSAAATNGATLNGWSTGEKNLKVPIIWEGSYTTGLSIFGSLGKFDYTAEVKNAAISSRPQSWSAVDVGFANPSFSGRLGYRPDEAWDLGVSGSMGTYLLPEAASMLAQGATLNDYRQYTLAQDAGYAWHHWQFWAEFYESRFQVPTVGNCDTLAYYLEAKYKFSEEWSAAVRWNQQVFNSIPSGFGGNTTWGSNVRDVDLAVTYRFSPHMQAKVQYSYLNQDDPVRDAQSYVAGQLTVRF